MTTPSPTDLRRWVFRDLGATVTVETLMERLSSVSLGGWSVEGGGFRYRIKSEDGKRFVDLAGGTQIDGDETRHALFTLAGRVVDVVEVARPIVRAVLDTGEIDGLNLRVVGLARGHWHPTREAQIHGEADLEVIDGSAPEAVVEGADPPGWADEIGSRHGWSTLGTYRFPRSPSKLTRQLVASLYSSNLFCRATPVFSRMPVGQYANLEGRRTNALLVLSSSGVVAMVHYDDDPTRPRTVLVPFADLKSVDPERRLLQGQVHVSGTGSLRGFTVGMMSKKEPEPFAAEAAQVHRLWSHHRTAGR